MDEVIYKPSAWQATFHALPHREALGAGSVGPGKTQALIHEPLAQIRVEHARMVGDPSIAAEPGTWLWDAIEKHPISAGSSTGWALFLRRMLEPLEQTLARCLRVFPTLDPGVKFNSTKKTFTFSTGYRYQFGHCYEIRDWNQYYSSEFTLIMYDELVQFDEEQYVQINSRLRSADPVLMHFLKIRSMSNPAQQLEASAKVRNPNWVREYFVAPAINGNVTIRKKFKRANGEEVIRDRIYLPARLSDNPDKEYVRKYEEELLNLPQHMQRALMDGNWFVTANSYFAPVWNEDIHVVPPFKIPPSWRRWRGLDWGMKSTGVCLWFAMDEEETVYVTREFAFKGKRVDVVADAIKQIETMEGLWKGRESRIYGAADTQLWEDRGDTGLTKAATMAKKGVRWLKADKSRMTNAYRIYHRLDDSDWETKRPGLVFFAGCRKTIQTLISMPADPNCIEVPLDGGEDHWYDALCYGVAMASRGKAGIPDHNLRRDGEERDDRDRGAFGYGI